MILLLSLHSHSAVRLWPSLLLVRIPLDDSDGGRFLQRSLLFISSYRRCFEQSWLTTHTCTHTQTHARTHTHTHTHTHTNTHTHTRTHSHSRLPNGCRLTHPHLLALNPQHHNTTSTNPSKRFIIYIKHTPLTIHTQDLTIYINIIQHANLIIVHSIIKRERKKQNTARNADTG